MARDERLATRSVACARTTHGLAERSHLRRVEYVLGVLDVKSGKWIRARRKTDACSGGLENGIGRPGRSN